MDDLLRQTGKLSRRKFGALSAGAGLYALLAEFAGAQQATDNEDKQAFALPPLDHIAFAVRDVEKTAKLWSGAFGLGSFEAATREIPGLRVGGQVLTERIKAVNFQMGALRVTLMEPLVDGPTRWFLDAKGEGVHHFCYKVQDHDAWVERMTSQGMQVAMEVNAELPGKKLTVSYLEAGNGGGVFFEILEVATLDST